MNKSQIKVLDKEIQYLCADREKIRAIRAALGMYANKSFLDEVKTIEQLFESCIISRKSYKSAYYYASTAGWTVQYFPNKQGKYKKNEKFKIHIFFSFVETDNFE